MDLKDMFGDCTTKTGFIQAITGILFVAGIVITAIVTNQTHDEVQQCLLLICW